MSYRVMWETSEYRLENRTTGESRYVLFNRYTGFAVAEWPSSDDVNSVMKASKAYAKANPLGPAPSQPPAGVPGAPVPVPTVPGALKPGESREDFIEEYMGWQIYQVSSWPPMHVEYVAYLEEKQYYTSETERSLHYSQLGQGLHNVAHVIHGKNVKEVKVQIETYGQLTRQAYLTQKYISENWLMLLFGAAYSGLLGLSMYQSYSWDT